MFRVYYICNGMTIAEVDTWEEAAAMSDAYSETIGESSFEEVA